MRSQAWQDYAKLVKAPDPLAVISSLKSPIEDLLRVANSDRNKIAVLNNFAMHAYQNSNPAAASERFEQAYALSKNPESLKNAVVAARQARNIDRIKTLFAAAVDGLDGMEASSPKAELLDSLCHAAGEMGDVKQAAKFGLASLTLKDSLADKPLPLNKRKRPTFDFLKPARNIIAFSLYGALPRYTRLAIENARASSFVFPGWTCRFYCDDKVPMSVIEELASLGAQVRIMPDPHVQRTLSGMFWRFWVAADPDVDFFLVRDADCLLSVREKVCVDEWIASDKDFHIMRDFYTHSELLLGGLWGGVAGRLATIERASLDFQAAIKNSAVGNHPHDQVFLRNYVWPAVRGSIMQHDSVFGGPNTKPFPPYGTIQPMRHVGQDMSIYMKQ